MDDQRMTSIPRRAPASDGLKCQGRIWAEIVWRMCISVGSSHRPHRGHTEHCAPGTSPSERWTPSAAHVLVRTRCCRMCDLRVIAVSRVSKVRVLYLHGCRGGVSQLFDSGRLAAWETHTSSKKLSEKFRI